MIKKVASQLPLVTLQVDVSSTRLDIIRRDGDVDGRGNPILWRNVCEKGIAGKFRNGVIGVRHAEVVYCLRCDEGRESEVARHRGAVGVLEVASAKGKDGHGDG